MLWFRSLVFFYFVFQKIPNYIEFEPVHHQVDSPQLFKLLISHRCSRSMLKPQPPAKPSIDLLAQAPTMDNNRLEKLVKNFVDEDKARIAAARNKAMPSSIQYALQKFEKGGSTTQPDGGAQAMGAYMRKTATLPSKKTNSYGQVNNFAPSPSAQVRFQVLPCLFLLFVFKFRVMTLTSDDT